jgi:hypothetical protein
MAAIATYIRACHPVPWTGRYDRIPGDARVFHLEHVNGELWPVIKWNLDGDWGTCAAVRTDAAAGLAAAVAQAKRRAGGSGGGCFVINEFGRILVPASDGRGQRFLAGDLQGRLLFENPFSPEEPIDMWDDSRLQCGDPWKLPYVGVPYHLHRNGRVYFYCQDGQKGRAVYPPDQDPELIRAMRSLRPRGPIRFIVNPAGFVLTKCPVDDGACSEDLWQPIFVGSISRNLWFIKE